MSNASLNKLSFKASVDEIKSIQKACDNLAKKTEETTAKESFDVAEINGKFYIIKNKTPNLTNIEIELINNKNIKAGTVLCTKDKNFFKKASTIQYFEQLLDTLKKAINRADEKECWND